MKHVQLFEAFVNEAVDANELIKHLESELDWNQGSAREVTDSQQINLMDFPKGPKSKNNIFITYTGMKGQSIAKDIRDAVKGFGAKALQVRREVGDNRHFYHIEIKK